MIAVVTVLLALPLGLVLRSRIAAMTGYCVAYLWAFTFQTLYLLLHSLADDGEPAFEAGSFPLAYGLVTASVLAVGLGLVEIGHRVGRRRRARTGAGRAIPAT